MKRFLLLIISLSAGMSLFQACNDYLDPYEYSLMSRDKVYSISKYVESMPVAMYARLPLTTGCTMATATDEAEHVDENNSSQDFNKGIWHANSSGDNVWSSCYRGIRTTCDFLDGTDTLTWAQFASNRATYLQHMRALCIGRGEAHFLRAYFYFELFKRYGEVPFITTRLDIRPDIDYSQFYLAPVKQIVDFIVDECDMVSSEGKYAISKEQMDVLTENGTKPCPTMYRDTLPTLYDENGVYSNELGRATKAAAYALKAKTLVYFASPQFNPDNDLSRWKAAAEACKKVIDLPASHYALETNFADIFNRKTAWSKEFLFVRKAAASNTFEKDNYPICCKGGSTGICPSQNLVDAFEYLESPSKAVRFDWDNPTHVANIYDTGKRDPRLFESVYVNNTLFNSATINVHTLQIYAGGNCDPSKYQASRTGYYLRKYIDPALDLNNNKTSAKTWVLMRMADFYLFYAECMNEAYGPDSDPDNLGMTAREAINRVRARAKMPDVEASTQSEFRDKVHNERFVELAFENHRWYDVRRWMQGDELLGGNLYGINIKKNGSAFSYEKKLVESRVYNQSKMKFYIINPTELKGIGKILTEDQ